MPSPYKWLSAKRILLTLPPWHNAMPASVATSTPSAATPGHPATNSPPKRGSFSLLWQRSYSLPEYDLKREGNDDKSRLKQVPFPFTLIEYVCPLQGLR